MSRKSGRPTVAFFGSSLLSSYWNGAATYYRGILRGMARTGYEVTFYEPDAFGRQEHRDMPVPDWARVVVYACEGEEHVLRALEEARRADILVKASGVGVFDDLLEKGVADLSGESRLTVFWDVDAPATLDRVRNEPADGFRDLVPRYDLVLTYGGGDPVVRGYRALGARDCHPVYNALDPDTHHPVASEERFESHLSLLANRLPDRERRVEEFFFRAAELRPDQRFLLGGSGWEPGALPQNVHHLGHVGTGDHNAFNCSALAVLNVTRESMALCGYSPPTRVFEAAGAAACLVTDAWEGIELFLEPEKEVLVARTGEEVAGALGELDPARARDMGRAARRRVLAEHTYDRRAEQVDALLTRGATVGVS